ncbi:toprim domain-containing protein [Candidatus Methanarcanum hacksteinii]|uniref:Toprim subdomain protein n=1 Tax=Candidatus Methanarcanum hacksteinii TaxID=2911857 RepID=UPI0015B32971|nr:Toprim subdomain protein [Methanomassiliicoccales archaeon]MDO5837570.1 Toprim subdomain protein [Methanomassiliicoccales archaeon]MDY4580038.1 Toprim subdomain protein [Candidatus Methanarcanum hacksteinii]
MNDDERLRRLDEILDRIQSMSSDHVILVEGKNDRRSLLDLNLSLDTIEVQRDGGPLRAAEMVYESGKKAIILTDWDDRGDRLAKDLSEQLSALCISYDMNIRKDLRDICIKDIKDVESLHSLYVRLERNVL